MKCDKCSKEDFKEWESGKTYEGIDRHHNPPEEVSRVLNEEWSGEFYNLCRECHKELHKLITGILKKYSSKDYDSDYWLMKYMTLEKINKQKKRYAFLQRSG